MNRIVVAAFAIASVLATSRVARAQHTDVTAEGTFSIVARDSTTGELGIAVQSKALATEDFDSARVQTELNRRGLIPESAGPNAWAIDDIAGFPIQICAITGVVPADAYKPYA